MSTVMDYIINLLFTLLQIVANDKIISHIVILILIKAGLMGEKSLIKHKKILSPDYNSYSL